jgi:hypothetical protein
VALIWNLFDKKDEFIKAQSEILFKYCPDYKDLSRSIFGKEISINFFENNIFEHRHFNNEKKVKLKAFVNGVMTSSFAPEKKEKNYNELIEDLTKLFNKYSCDGKINLPYRTHCFIGKI